VEQTVAVVETRTDDAHCDRFSSSKCETWTDVAQSADMKVAQCLLHLSRLFQKISELAPYATQRIVYIIFGT